MTLRELSQLNSLRKEIAMDEIRLKELELKSDARSPNLYDIRSSCMPSESDRVGNIVAEIDILRGKIYDKKYACIKELNRLEDYIESIDDSFTRQIFELRYQYGMNWIEVAHAMGGGNTPDGVKKRCQRYIRKHNTPGG